MNWKNVGAILAALMLVITAAASPVAAASISSTSDKFAPTVTEDVGLLGYSPGEDVVRYGSDGVPGWFVKYENGSRADLETWVDSSESRSIERVDNESQIMLITAPSEKVRSSLLPWGGESLADLSYVEWIGVNRRVGVDPIGERDLESSESWEAPSGSFLATQGGLRGSFDADGATWGPEVNETGLDQARERVGADNVSVDGTGVRVAVIDTGLDYSSDLYGERVPTGYNAITNETLNISDPANATDSDYTAIEDGSSSNHGSWVATAIAGNGSNPNGTGVAPNATLVPVKALGDDGQGTIDNIARGLEWACNEGNADVVSMSLGAPMPSDRLDSEIRECLEESDVSAIVVAAGNNRLTYRYVSSPADSGETVVTVGATDSRAINTTESAYFSAVGPDPETGASVDLAAPGFKITTETAEGNVTLSGTSMATPIVSGSIALMLDADPSLVGQETEVLDRISSTAEPVPNAGTTEVGAGRLSASNAVENIEPSSSQSETRDDEAAARDEGNQALAGSFWRGFGLSSLLEG